MNAQEVVDKFFTAYYLGDETGTRAIIADDLRLDGPFASTRTAEEFIEVAKGLMQIVRGHEVRTWVVNGETIAALYDIVIQGPNGSRPLTVGGFFTVTNDHVATAELIYDNEAFHAIMNGTR
ncbi:nuclear transport factor 2 family protein [Subtercola endophyticus]|uniref:nuclear transport factor 2 family protein n=1 Tax=Subtercola endophyticus TaxID=2895559 RepID=UPI001E3A0086|nr:nuclear transport factor 2 family protein [Subtercola endophyticus]UFS60588.1 nuclear transport factor 2 family protein [Subtercola endophyticus]